MALKDHQALQQIGLFKLLDDDELAVLAQELEEVEYLAGKLIFSQGDQGGKMYIVQTGRVEIFLYDVGNERVSLGMMGAGDLFGEFSLLDNEPRSASAKALENTTLMMVDRNDLQTLITAHPMAALDMMEILSRRIRESTNLVQERMIRNVNQEMPPLRTFGDRLSDGLTQAASSIYFVYFSFIWFAAWILLNTGVLPGIQAFDPFPFGFLTMVVSLEAIFLSLFVLISQNRQAVRDKLRNDIEYEANIKAELEIRHLQKQLDAMQETIVQHLTHFKPT